MPTIPFDAVNDAARASLRSLLHDWFPRGRVRGHEFKIGNVDGDAGESLSVNMTTGTWKDFAEDIGGGDPISLYAAKFHGGDRVAAARALGAKLDVYLNGSAGRTADPPKPKADPEPAWRPMVPPPADAPPAGNARGGFDQLYDYRGPAGELLCYVRRKEATAGRTKLFVPLTYGELDGLAGWHAKAPDAPRPLYGLDQLAARPAAPVIVCEGEKAAIAAAHLYPDHVCISWMGGAKAVHTANWQPLSGRDLIVWPDADPGGAEAATAILARFPAGRAVRVDGLAHKYDAADLLAEHPADPEAWLRDRLPQTPPTALWSAPDDWEEASIPPRPWIARGYLLRGSVTVVSGAGSAGKSSLMCSYAAALGLGKPFHRMSPTRACRVMTYNVEDDADEQRRRFSAVLRHMGNRPVDLRGQVSIIGPNQVGTLLTRDAHTGAVTFTPAMAEMQARIEAFRPDVLILDPLTELHGCEENDNTALRAIVATFRTLAVKHGMAVVLLHHTRKGSAAAAGDPDTSRGASSIVGAARIVLTVTSMTDEEAKAFGLKSGEHRYYFRLDGAKSNYAPIEAAEWFERQAYALDNGDQVAAAVPWEPPADLITPAVRAAIEDDIALGSPTGPYSPRLSADARSVRHLFVRHGVTTGAGQLNLINALIAAGFEVAPFRKANRAVGSGLRTPDGRPGNVAWDAASVPE